MDGYAPGRYGATSSASETPRAAQCTLTRLLTIVGGVTGRVGSIIFGVVIRVRVLVSGLLCRVIAGLFDLIFSLCIVVNWLWLRLLEVVSGF